MCEARRIGVESCLSRRPARAMLDATLGSDESMADEQKPILRSGSEWTDDVVSSSPTWVRVLGVVALVVPLAVGAYFVWWLVAGRPF